jgi:eukaryotic-like serine/threonine-protein kinase
MSYPRFGKYILFESIGTGGMAEICRAKALDAAVNSPFVAIKRMLPDFEREERFLRMFEDEVRLVMALEHPHIVPAFEKGSIRGLNYFSMPYIRGRTLGRLLFELRKQGRMLPVNLALQVMASICSGLEHAHSLCDDTGVPLQVIHRDVSPENILLGFDGGVWITDFGIAKARKRRTEKTQTGTLKGKLGYMSPEQVKRLPLDARTDIYNMGIVLFEMLTGQRLFSGEGELLVFERMRHGTLPPLDAWASSLPQEIIDILLQALAPLAEDRFVSAQECLEKLEVCIDHNPPAPHEPTLEKLMRVTFRQQMAEEALCFSKEKDVFTKLAKNLDFGGESQLSAPYETIKVRSLNDLGASSSKTFIVDSDF